LECGGVEVDELGARRGVREESCETGWSVGLEVPQGLDSRKLAEGDTHGCCVVWSQLAIN